MSDLSIETRRQQLRFRAWHRGTREADLVLGPFADAFLPSCPPEQVEEFARLLDVEDPDLWDWVTRKKPVEPSCQGIVMNRLLAFIDGRMKK